MVSLSVASSRSPSSASLPQNELSHVPQSLVTMGPDSASSSKTSLASNDQDATITSKNRMVPSAKGKQRSQDDLRLLAVSTHMTEISYSISDIQTRIFEIQELRHQSQSSGDDAGSSTGVIDQSLMNLDERLESVSQAIKSVNDSLSPLQERGGESDEEVHLLRKHAALLSEWEAIQDESDVLREELKEDKWLTVFRTVSEQADGMMSSLEKAVNKCHEFIWQVHRRGHDPISRASTSDSHSLLSDKSSLISYEVYAQLLDSFEAKKKHYMPATSKVLSIIDKGVQDRVTKNGECLRRHAESTQRWKNLRERIARIDREMETVRKILINPDVEPSENGSTASMQTSKTGKSTQNGYLATPSSTSGSRSGSGSGSKTSSHPRAPSTSSVISRSVSPFRKIAQRIKNGARAAGRSTPSGPSKSPSPSRVPSSEPVATISHRASFFGLRSAQSASPGTPSRGHQYSQSLTPDSSPSSRAVRESTISGEKVRPSKPAWNSSTKVDEGLFTIKPTPPRRPSASGLYGRASGDVPPVPPIPSSLSGMRSVSRSSFASSRPWSPVTSSVSTAYSSHHRPPQHSRPPSRAESPGMGMTIRPRPSSPSHIPVPKSTFWNSLNQSWDDEDEAPTSLMQRAMSPSLSTSAVSATSSDPRARSRTPNEVVTPTPRPPSRSMIPVPSFRFSSASRPSSAASQNRASSPALSFTSSVMRAQTPESGLRAKLQQLTFYQSSSNPRATPRPTLLHKVPPSSFRDSSTPTSARGSNFSRPASRNGAYTPGLDQNPMHLYKNVNPKDPLDVEVASIVNSIAHGLLVERVDPPLRTSPRDGEEIKAQYAFSNALARKVVTCKLTTSTRSGGKGGSSTTTKKVMCRVGGGWQDLQLYMLNRQSGM